MCACVYRCLITAPNIVHLGVEETVTVQLQGAIKPTQYTLYFLYQTADNKVLSEKKHVTLNEANGYQAVVKMRVSMQKANLFSCPMELLEHEFQSSCLYSHVL